MKLLILSALISVVLALFLGRAPLAHAGSNAPESDEDCVDFILDLAEKNPQGVAAAKEQILEHITEFNAHTRALAVRTLAGRLGLHHDRNPLARMQHVSNYTEMFEQLDGQPSIHYCLTQLVNAHLADIYYGKYSSQALRKRLYGNARSANAIIISLAPERLQEVIAARISANPELSDSPRLAIADEEHPVQTVLQDQVTNVQYDSSLYEGIPTAMTAGPGFDLHLFGYMSLDTLSEELERVATALKAKNRSLNTLRVHIYPEFHLIEGMAPEYSLEARLNENPRYIETFKHDIFEEMNITSALSTFRNEDGTLTFSAFHGSSLEIRIVLEPKP